MRLVRPSCVVNSIHRPPGSSITLPPREKCLRRDTLTIGLFRPRKNSEAREVGAARGAGYRIWWTLTRARRRCALGGAHPGLSDLGIERGIPELHPMRRRVASRVSVERVLDPS